MKEEELNAGFKKQRMFLIGVSLAIMGMHFLNLSFVKINILGNEATIGNQSYVSAVALLILIWAPYRYVVWFIDCNAWAAMRRAHTDLVDSSLKRAMKKHPPEITEQNRAEIRKEVAAVFKPERATEAIEILISAEPDIVQYVRDKPFAMIFVIVGSVTEGGQVTRAIFGINKARRLLPKGMVTRKKVYAVFGMAIVRRYASEYLVPPICGAMALACIEWKSVVDSVRTLFV